MSQSNFVVYQFADQLLAEVVLIISPFAYEKTTSEMFRGAFHLFCGVTEFFLPKKLPFCSRRNFFTDKFGQNRGRRQPNKKRGKKGLRRRNMPLRHRNVPLDDSLTAWMPPRRFGPSGVTIQSIRSRLVEIGAGCIRFSDLPCEFLFFRNVAIFRSCFRVGETKISNYFYTACPATKKKTFGIFKFGALLFSDISNFELCSDRIHQQIDVPFFFSMAS